MIFESANKIHNKKTADYTAEWSIDTDTQTVIHINKETYEINEHSFYSDSVRYHLHYSEEYFPDRLQKLVDEGKILEYIEDFELKVKDEVNKQTEIYMRDSKEYQIAVESGNLYMVGSIGNMLEMQARESVFAAMVYV